VRDAGGGGCRERRRPSHLWDALGLPLTAFNDSRRSGTIRSIGERDFQPYQRAVVRLTGRDGAAVLSGGKPGEFTGANPVDFPNCYLCHGGGGRAAIAARAGGLTLFDREYAYGKNSYPDMTDFMARQLQAAINVLELHDARHGTHFLKSYDPAASTNRLGAVGPVNCADCHGDNISGNLQEPRPGATGYVAVKARPLTEAIHMAHARFIPFPDKAGRTQNCQACHPSHWQQEAMNDVATNPFSVLDAAGNPRFDDGDVRSGGGGCYLRGGSAACVLPEARRGDARAGRQGRRRRATAPRVECARRRTRALRGCVGRRRLVALACGAALRRLPSRAVRRESRGRLFPDRPAGASSGKAGSDAGYRDFASQGAPPTAPPRSRFRSASARSSADEAARRKSVTVSPATGASFR
jgi:hypothetical protein